MFVSDGVLVELKVAMLMNVHKSHHIQKHITANNTDCQQSFLAFIFIFPYFHFFFVVRLKQFLFLLLAFYSFSDSIHLFRTDRYTYKLLSDILLFHFLLFDFHILHNLPLIFLFCKINFCILLESKNQIFFLFFIFSSKNTHLNRYYLLRDYLKIILFLIHNHLLCIEKDVFFLFLKKIFFTL